MAWYPGAVRMELQPESDQQAAIRPTQLILHSIAAPWDEKRIYEYWRDSTNLESHFGLDFDGSLGQFIGTETKADANYRANLRPDGTGAISLESASNLQHTDPWTAAQIEQLIRLGVWVHETHAIPLRICRSAGDPGFGYHSLHSDWSVGGTACPGTARIRQFREIVFPGIVARVNGQTTPEEEMPLTADDVKRVAAAVWAHLEQGPPSGNPVRMGAALGWMDHVHANQNTKLADINAKVEALQITALTPAQITAIATEVADLLAERMKA